VTPYKFSDNQGKPVPVAKEYCDAVPKVVSATAVNAILTALLVIAIDPYAFNLSNLNPLAPSVRGTKFELPPSPVRPCKLLD
ncbi:MAG TPA: hypothetical protein VFM18_21695, partial [Methanosarcina sp.]|nr:hypothetical protein [Methanosarcina sp.]